MKKWNIFKLLFASVLLAFSSVNSFANYVGTGIFVKVTSMDELTDGFYVVGSGKYAMSVVEKSIANKSPLAEAADIKGNLILQNPDEIIVWEIKKIDGKYAIFSDAYGYLTSISKENKVEPLAEYINASLWDFLEFSGGFRIKNGVNTDYFVGFNTGNPSNDEPSVFAQYKSTTSVVYLDLDIYKLNENTCTSTNLIFPETIVSKSKGDANFIMQASSLNTTLPIVYSSSNTSVATVNSSTGEVSILGGGVAEIIAVQEAGTSNEVDYCIGVAECLVTVTDIENVVITAKYQNKWYALPVAEWDGLVDAVEITVVDNKVQKPANNLIWCKEYTNDGSLTLKNTDVYLAYSGSGTGLAFDEQHPYHWILNENNILSSKEAPARSLAFRKSQEWNAQAGALQDTWKFGGYLTTSNGTSGYVFKIEFLEYTSTNTSIENDQVESLFVYTFGNNIHFNANDREEVEIYNVSGQKIMDKETVEGENIIQLSAKGFFLIKVGNRTGKVIL